MASFIKLLAFIAIVCLKELHAMAADGLNTVQSSFGPKDTMMRLEAEVKAKAPTRCSPGVDHARRARPRRLAAAA